MENARPRPRIAHIALKVADVERAARFYEEVFGFRRTDTRTERGRTSCHLTDGTVDLAMVEFHDGAGEIGWAAGSEPCIHHFGIDVDDVEAYVEKLAGAGAEIVDDPGGRTLKFRAPGGGGITEIAPAGWHDRRTGSPDGGA